MITAELSYNPYLREMAVKFNGQPPHINSLVEKYQDCPLQDWITEIPFIFHDEMNGYGFELDFCGTELDFDEVRNAFHMQAVSESEVQIILKNALECREAKIDRIIELLEWLENNRFRHFDFEQFRIEHHDLVDIDFVCIVLHGDVEKPVLKNITIEKVDNVGELERTDLTHTPILYCLSNDSISMLSRDLNFFKRRKDVTSDQLFFCIGEGYNVQIIKRLLNDHGISTPRLVSGIQNRLARKQVVTCEYDELSENNLLNQILKTTVMLLLCHADVDPAYKNDLKKEMLFFSNVDTVDPALIRWSAIRFQRNNNTYRMLISLCQLILEGMLLTEDSGEYRLASFIDPQRMSDTILTLNKIQQIVKPLAEKYQISEVYIFGSYARKEATPSSDIDFLVFGGDNFKMTTIYAFTEELRIQIQKDIDVFEINEVNCDSSFYEAIMKERVRVV